MKGTLTIPANGMTGAVEMYAARPNKSFTKTTVAGIGDIAEGFDGKTAWSMSPMTGPMLATGEELAQKRIRCDFDSHARAWPTLRVDEDASRRRRSTAARSTRWR